MKNVIQNFRELLSAIQHLAVFKLTKKNNEFTQPISLRFCLLATLSLLVFSGCEGDTDDLLLEEEKSIINLTNDVQSSTVEKTGIYDAAHGGTEGFYFLPPMVKSPLFSGTFDSNLSPVVEIFESPASNTLHTKFTMEDGDNPDLLKVDIENEHYLVNWHTNETGTLVGQTYRIRISIAGTVVGYADVQMAENGKEAKNLTDGAAIALVDGRTLPIKFRIEEGAINIIGPEGGVLRTNDGFVNLKIPANALDENINITIESVEDELNDPDIVPGAIFDFGPSPYSFNEDLTLTIKYDPANLPEGVLEDELRLLAVVNGEWVQLPGSSVDVVNHTVTGPLTSFSRKGVGRGKVHAIQVLPADPSIAVGETVQLEAVLTSVDGEVMSRKVQWSSSDEAIATVDNSGLITALAAGEVRIEAKSGKISSSANLIVAAATSKAFVTKWDTSSDRYSTRIALALAGTVDATVDWGDGTEKEEVTGPGPHYHSYAVDGTYIVSVSGTVTAYNNYINGGDLRDKQKLIEVISWGDVGFTNLNYAFQQAQNLLSVPTNSVGIEKVTEMKFMFSGTWHFNQDIGDWNTENVTNMMGMFSGASSFNQNIGNWNTGKVTNMSYMFANTGFFNQDIGNWDTANVIDMQAMFYDAGSFNQDIGGWDTGKVTTMKAMFNSARRFNRDLGGWNTANVTNMESMFQTAYAFNGDIGNWDTGKVTTMKYMFWYAQMFNRNIGGWDTGNVTDMDFMFPNAAYFNQDIGNWNTQNVLTMEYMFSDARSFNQDLSKWCVSQITSEPTGFSTGVMNWNLPKPVWGSCPTNSF